MSGREIAGRYRMLAKLGEGGMGAVYRAEQISLKRKVAVKLLRPELSSQPGLVRRFNAEAELAAKLSHPNTVNIYDFGQDADGTLFIAMEYVEGKSLRQVLAAGGPMPPERALHIVAQIASSLADAHAHGIVHRDLKPDNVMLTERGKQKDVVRVLDFGIAKLRDDGKGVEQAMTRAGDLVGTPQYMAPEQIRAEAVDGRTDVYAVGAMLFEMLTGRLPFEGPTLMAILSKHLVENLEPPSRRRPELGIPPALDQLVLETMAKEPAARTASMERLGERVSEVATALGARIAFGPVTGPSTAQVPVGGSPSAPAFAPPPPPPPPSGPGVSAFPPPPTPGRPMRPPGVPHTYPPGVMVAPPELTPPPPSPSPTPAPPPQYASPYPAPPPSPYAPPGYAPPGAASPPLPSGTPPPPSYQPTPASAPVVQRPAPKAKSNRALIIVLVALALAGAAVAVVLVLWNNDKAGGGSGSSAAAADDGDDGGDGDDELRGPPKVTITQEGLIDPWSTGDVVHTRLGSSLTLPAGMVRAPASVDGAESFYYQGVLDGANVRVLLLELPENSAGTASQDLAQRIIDGGNQHVGDGEQLLAGREWRTVIIEGKDLDDLTPLKTEIMMVGDGKRVVALFVGTSPQFFDSLASLRTQIFSRNFQP
jgi:serine/threonine-protein kinase